MLSVRIIKHCTLRITAKSSVTHLKLEKQSSYAEYQGWCEYRYSLWDWAREHQVGFCLGYTHRVYWFSNIALENSPSRAWDCELSCKRKKKLFEYPLQYLIDSNKSVKWHHRGKNITFIFKVSFFSLHYSNICDFKLIAGVRGKKCVRQNL